ncbi:M23 family metallopeptidase [Parabacteroides sp. OttesenSCG-928-G07]|nr:M23 family metallopeptidase [Parabacteroides sp. OttesenSCG-928-G21]MDL2277926.1 M23 family metallopeptidase [Parabacteroides sp. OttesenSCG-928-G07]
MRHRLYVFSIILLAGIVQRTAAQQEKLPNPFDFPILLSGNFGELRSNHFHSGIDFKTQGAEGKAVHVTGDGFLSRISVSPGGYGNALYVDHPDGTTTVYAHLQRFTAEVAAYVKEEQYKAERFAVNLTPSPEQFPVKKGEVIAWSGNTGSSSGPHLHFEIRHTETEEVIDPLPYFQSGIIDERAPRIQGVMVYPIEGEGVVNGGTRKREYKQFAVSGGRQTINQRIEAWGKIGLGVKAYDYMNNTSNIYGVKEVVLEIDGEQVFRSDLDRFAFDESRYINSFIDYEEWAENRSFYMKSFIEPGNRLRFLQGRDRGYLTINEERPYELVYTLTDIYGNKVRLAFTIQGKEQPIPQPDTTNTTPFHWASVNRFGAKGVRLTIPSRNLYTDLLFHYTVDEDSTGYAAVHHLHNRQVALHRQAQLSIRVQNDTLENKAQYGIVHIYKGRKAWTGGSYRDGWVDANIRELGSYSVAVDTVSPTITPVSQSTWVKNQRFSFRLSDNLSGVSTYHGEIDGEYVLFEMNNRSVITYHFDKEKLERGRHTLRLCVTDACGNESVFEHSFSW